MKKEISDSLALQITELSYNSFKEQTLQERIDLQRLKQLKDKFIKPLYPIKEDEIDHKIRKYNCNEICCQQNPGRFCCCNSKFPDRSYIQLGLATCLYVKFLKHVNLFFFFLALLSLTSCTVCFAVATQNNFTPTGDYSTFFFSTTYGAFSSQHIKCQYALIQNNIAQISVTCPQGNLNASIILSRITATLSNESMSSLYNCRNERKSLLAAKNWASPFLVTGSEKNVTMHGSSSASATLTFNGSQTSQTVAYIYQCKDNVYVLGKLSASSDNAFFYVVCVDLFFCITFILFLVSESFAEDKDTKFFKQEQVSLDDFTVQIEGITRNTAEKQITSLMTYLFSQLNVEFKNSLVCITIPEVEEEIEQQEERKEIFDKFYDITNQYYFKDQQTMPEFKHCHESVRNKFSESQYSDFKQKIKEYTNELVSLQRREAIKESNQKISIYMVFNNVIVKEKVMFLQKNYCCSSSIPVEDPNGQVLDFHLTDPYVPDMIKWQNRHSWTKVRFIIAWIITLVLCGGSYLLFGFIQMKRNQLMSSYNYNIDCKVLYPSVNFGTYDTNKAAQSNNYLTCYCESQSLFNVISSKSDYCSSWQKQYILYKAVPLLISLGIVIYNVIIAQMYRYLTYFERHKYAVYGELSYAFKRALLLTLNLGLIMILLNINYKNDIKLKQVNFVFLGQYDDFTPDWYYGVGSVIIFTMIFNIAFPIIQLLFACIFKGLKKCWDTRCCTVATSRQTKTEYLELYQDDKFPIGQRYAYLMSTFLISMSFSGVFPILIPVTAVSLFLLYFADKILLFKIYQVPLNYTTALHRALMAILFISLLSHLGLTAFFLTQTHLIAQSATITGQGWIIDSGNSRVDLMFKTAYVLPYIFGFIFLVLFVFLRKVLRALFDMICCCCRVRLQLEKSEAVQRLNLYNILSQNQKECLKASIGVGIQKIEMRKREKRRSELDIPTSGYRLSQNQNGYADFLTQQQQILTMALDELKKRRPESHNQMLLGLPTYEIESKLQDIKKTQKMLVFQRRLKTLMCGEAIQSLQSFARKVDGQANDQSKEGMFFRLDI